MKIIDTIQQEVSEYLGGTTQISEGVTFSQHKLVRRIYIYKNREYPKGKISKKGEYKYWFDIIQPRVNGEVKNLRIDQKNILVFSRAPIADFPAVFTLNAALNEWMLENGRAEELNEVVEQFSSDGNILFKKIKGGYTVWDPENTFIINQAAKTVDSTPIVERSQLTQSELRSKSLWKNVDAVIKNCGNKFFEKTPRTGGKSTTNPLYEIYERNGEISEKELFEAQGKEGGDESKYVLARIIVAGIANRKKDERYVLYAEKLSGKLSEWFIEAHRGPYKGRWFREGLYELLFDHQYRANEIGIQLARGLDWASKVILRSKDAKIVQNIRTDMANGDIIKSEDLTQVNVRMQGLDQLIADWNRLIKDADAIANSFEVIQGQNLPSGTPFRLGMLLDTNATKFFVMLRQKIGIAYKQVFSAFVLPEIVKDMKGKDIVRVTGDSKFIERFRLIAVESWYVRNLVRLAPHTAEMAQGIKQQKMRELEKTDPLIENSSEIWENVLPRLQVTITGENTDIAEQLETLANLLQFEQDPIRRAFLLDTVYAAKGIPVPPPVQAALVDPAKASQIPGEPSAERAAVA